MDIATSSHDPRDRLVREKYFSLRPKPLERYLWQQGLPQSAERVFWLHWEEGMRAGDWCSQVPLRRVASLCCLDTSTVTRAYQLLKKLDLIRRADPGRDPDNPFQQATAVTEVRVPRGLLTELSRSPNRPLPRAEIQARAGTERAPAPLRPTAPTPHAAEGAAAQPAAHPTRQQIQAMWERASTPEKSRYFEASRQGLGQIDFDTDTALTLEDRRQILAQLAQLARARAEKPKAPAVLSPAAPAFAPPRRLTILELARTRKKLSDAVPSDQVQEVLRQVTWAVEEGGLRRFELPLAVNIALKKIREGAWTRPHRMPPNWARHAAHTETCHAA